MDGGRWWGLRRLEGGARGSAASRELVSIWDGMELLGCGGARGACLGKGGRGMC